MAFALTTNESRVDEYARRWFPCRLQCRSTASSRKAMRLLLLRQGLITGVSVNQSSQSGGGEGRGGDGHVGGVVLWQYHEEELYDMRRMYLCLSVRMQKPDVRIRILAVIGHDPIPLSVHN